jgi:hypothetical protein
MRRNGFAGELTMIDRLKGLPLERPPLSKAFLLAGDDDEESFALRASGWFWRPGRRRASFPVQRK